MRFVSQTLLCVCVIDCTWISLAEPNWTRMAIASDDGAGVIGRSTTCTLRPSSQSPSRLQRASVSESRTSKTKCCRSRVASAASSSRSERNSDRFAIPPSISSPLKLRSCINFTCCHVSVRFQARNTSAQTRRRRSISI